MDQPTIHQKSLTFIDTENPLQELFMSSFIYSAHYYPLQLQWLYSIITKCTQTSDHQALLSSVQVLLQDLNRQIIYGPTAVYVPASERPHNEHLDLSFTIQQKDKNTLLDLVKQVACNSWINQFIPSQDIQQLLWYRRSNFIKLHGFVNRKVSGPILQQLEVNGQSWIRTIPLPTLFLVMRNALKHLVKLENINPRYYLLLGRLSYIHNKILQNPAKQLADDTLGNYRKYIGIVTKKKQLPLLQVIELLLQYGNALLFYYKYNQCQKVIQYCKKIANLKIQFTGKLGRRTKYQSFDTPQLVMNIKNRSNEVLEEATQEAQEEKDSDQIQIPDPKQLVAKQLQNSEFKVQSTQLHTSSFDQDNILLQRPKLIQQQNQNSEKNNTTLYQILVTLSAIQYTWETTPKDQIIYLYISSSIQTILDHKQLLTYPLMFNVLLLRSLNEFPRLKNVERALDQMQKLKTYYNEKTTKSVQFLYSSAYSPYFDFIKTLAQKYMEIGLNMTAIELFERVGMVQQCIDGFISRSYKQKAHELAIKFQKQNGNTPRLLCMLGDLAQGDECIKFYEQAWELSKNRNARSQRSLGWHYFRKNQYRKAAQAFKKATEANFYHPNTWFTLGCCYMQLKQLQKAIPAFGQCVCIDDSQGQAWGNIATCYMHQNRLKEAFSTLQQALKHSEKSWKMWSNMLSISLKLKKFYKYFECVEKLVQLQKSQMVNPEILHKLIIMFQYQQNTSERRKGIQAMKNRLDRLYKFLVSKIGQHSMVWQSIYEYNLELEKFTIENYKHYKKLHSENKIDRNDLLQGFETEEGLDSHTQKTLKEVRENILSSKQTQLNMAMKIGWDSNKKQSEQVYQVLKDYIKVYQKYGDKINEGSKNQFYLFIKGVHSKIQHCLEKKVQLTIPEF